MRKVGLGDSSVYFILRDGITYFLTKLLLNTVGVILACSLLGLELTHDTFNLLRHISMLGRPLTFILINRLVLNLRRASHIREGNLGSLPELAFATDSVLGNLGAPLRVDAEIDDEIEEIGDEVEVFELEEI
ncbi:hypothetical protein BD410DRAFT_845412 [Rickenella mellea]|uniref:Uncharacterized protein n=1 Tax=Rickenella mellea TaxID=50990 RepID=A0A4Y7PJF8_9AGAM|nr:hypothetical protein BD410DRAFT_845412 [Rickenella mellea]